MIPITEERRAEASRVAKKLFADMQYDGAYEYAKMKIAEVSNYANKVFWMLVRQDIRELKYPKSSAELKYRPIAGQSKLEEIL